MNTSITVAFSPRKVLVFLLALIAALTALHVAVMLTHYRFFEIHYLIRDRFNLDVERGFGTWVSALILVAAGVLLLHIAGRSSARPNQRVFWLVLGLGFLFLSLDEIVGLHETLNTVIDNTWTLPGAIVAGIVGIAYLPFLLSLPARTRWLFVIAGAVYLGGALGVERIGNWFADESLLKTLEYSLLVGLEEAMEMTGASIFVYALLQFIGRPESDDQVQKVVAVAEAPPTQPQTPQTNAATGRPSSATDIFAGLIGMAGGTVAFMAMHGWDEADYIKSLVVLASCTIPMIAYEVLVRRVYRAPSSGLSAAPVNPLNVPRIVQKLVGFWFTLCVIGAAYWLMPEYGSFYEPFKKAVIFCLPWLIAAAPVYIWFVDRRQLDPVDAYVDVYRLLLGHKPASWNGLRTYALGWLVKAFFLPLMFVFLTNSLRDIWAWPAFPSFENFARSYDYFYSLIFLWDVMLASLGYMLTLRLLDSHIRSTEPTVLGWLVCIACYPPFWGLLGSNYLAYETDDLYWGQVFGSVPAVYIAWGCLILALVAIYVWATAMFGVRFSNLTHRGIITNGPYRWVKHPAYLAKNISWWMISVPFLSSADLTGAIKGSILLLGVNFIYYMRAVTEERHLSRDPVYREYQAYIAEHGLLAHLRRMVGLKAKRTEPALADVGKPAE